MTISPIVSPDHWFRVIVELEAVYTIRELAGRTGASKSAIDRAKNHGIEPRYSPAMRLMVLHKLLPLKVAICPKYGTAPTE